MNVLAAQIGVGGTVHAGKGYIVGVMVAMAWSTVSGWK